jgi:hypothetical protein
MNYKNSVILSLIMLLTASCGSVYSQQKIGYVDSKVILDAATSDDDRTRHETRSAA